MNQEQNIDNTDNAHDLNTGSPVEPQLNEATPGDLLREARQARGISTDQVATQLRLRKQLIEELEENKFDPKVAGTFTRGYLRSYAKYLELPEQQVLDAYYALGLEEPRKESMQSFSRKKSKQTQDSRLMIITWIIVVVLVASAILFAWQQSKDAALLEPAAASIDTQPASNNRVQNTALANAFPDTTGPETAEPETAEPETAEPETTDPAATDPETGAVLSTGTQNTTGVAVSPTEVIVTEQAEQPSEQTGEPSTAGEQEPAPERAEQAELDTISEPLAASEGATELANTVVDVNAGDLVLHFRGDCWVRIDDAEGNTLAFGVKQAGYTMPLNGVQPYSLTLGAPHLVDVYFQGEAVDMSSLRDGRVARLTVPEA
ncbi:RodZ domain-containing protein [Aliidiomarina celeris]|uniref:RodZ domain-containing protein n=1 Tax=Aliidiomarina celeris TaxID=2249428 RepID=UPI000DE99826|nr:RodZ domain-containing protein [Aliidiomarina celeris]